MGLFSGGGFLSNAANTGLSFIPGVGAYMGQQETNASNAQQASKQMDFQREMANTSYQRGVADMTAAGVNPMLAYAQGGASTPSGAMATMQNAKAHLGQTVSSAMEALSLRKDLQQKDENIALTAQQTKNAKNTGEIQEFDKIRSLNEATDSHYQQKSREGDKTVPQYYKDLQESLTQQNRASAKQAEVEQKHSEYDKFAAPVDAILRRLPSILAPANSAKKLLSPSQPNTQKTYNYNRNNYYGN
nr:MAG: DNA pilot protein [Microvirus sp.]